LTPIIMSQRINYILHIIIITFFFMYIVTPSYDDAF